MSPASPQGRCQATDDQGNLCGSTDWEPMGVRWACAICGTYADSFSNGLRRDVVRSRPTYDTPPIKSEIRPGDVDPVSEAEHRGHLILAKGAAKEDPAQAEHLRRAELVSKAFAARSVAERVRLAGRLLVDLRHYPPLAWNAELAATIRGNALDMPAVSPEPPQEARNAGERTPGPQRQDEALRASAAT